MYNLPPPPEGYTLDPWVPAPALPAPPRRGAPVSNAMVVAQSIYPDIEITDWSRDPNSRLGRANPRSWHVRSQAAIDSRPLPGMTFDEYLEGYRARGFDILEARDEVTNPSSHATGPHWHAVLGGGPADGPRPVEPDPLDAPPPPGFRLDAPQPAPTPGPSAPPTLPQWQTADELAGHVQAAIEHQPTPPRQFRGNAAPHQLMAPTTETGPVSDDAYVARITTRNDPRLAGVNAQFRAMYMDRGVSARQMTAFLTQHGITPGQVPALGRALAIRPRWLAAAPAQRGPVVVNLDDIPLPDDQQGDRVITSDPLPAASSPSVGRDFQQATISEHHPGVTERIGNRYGDAVGTVTGDRYFGAEHGRRMDAFLSNPLSPVQAFELAGDAEERRQRALVEGRFIDATGNELDRNLNMLGVVPIVGRARGAAQLAGKALQEVEQLAVRNGIGEVGPAADDAIANIVRSRWADLTPETRQVLAPAPDAFSPARLGELRLAANPPPSALERGVTALRSRFGRRGEAAPDVAAPAALAGAPDAVQNLPGRAIDRIDINTPPPPGYTLDEPLGRIAPLGEQPTPAELADVVRPIRPEDVTPIPGNRIETEAEAIRANPGTIRDVQAPRPEIMLQMRPVPHRSRPNEFSNHRGPIDAEAFLRLQGGIRDDGGELRHIGLNNRPRPESPGDRVLGPLVNPSGLSPDEAAFRLWEAGYLPQHAERPEVSDLLEVLRSSRNGYRTWHPSDLDEVGRFEGAQGQRFAVDAAAQEGAPLAERVGQPIGPGDLAANNPPATAYEDLPRVGGTVGNINLAHIESGADIRRLLSNVEDRFSGFDAARRGTITHAETRALADELGMTADDLLRRRRGQALNAEQALAARQLMAKSADEVLNLAARATGPEASDASRAAFSEALLRHGAIHENVTGATAEAGRALQQFRMAARSRAISDRIHQAAAEGMGGEKRLDDIAQGILDLQLLGVTPGGINHFAVHAIKPRFSDKLVELWYNSLLSGPQTHVVNTVSNAMTQALQLPEHALAAALGQGGRVVRKLRGQPESFDRVMVSELGPRVVGLMQGSREGLRAFGRTLRTGDVEDFVTKVEARTQHAISGVKGAVLRTPTRLLAAEDEFFKATARRMELNGLAVRRARSEGLRGQAFRDRVADLARNPTEAMLVQAMDYARYLTFQRPLGQVGNRLTATTRDHPWLKLFFPFIRTPTNLLKFATERSPTAFLLREVRADMKAGGARRQLAIARIMLGTGLGVTVAELVANGTITGGGPANRGALDLMKADGWQPYSIRIGGTYYSYARLDPVSTTIGVAADMVEYQDRMTEGQRQRAGALLITSIIRNLGNKTWLSGMADLVGVIEDPQRNMSNFLGRLGGSAAVPAIVAQTSRALDPVQRESSQPTFSTEGTIIDDLGLRSTLDPMLGRIQSRLPGVSQSLPARRDAFGRDLRSEGGLGPDSISPIWTRQARNDPVARELLEIDASIGRPARTLRGERLTPRQYGDYQALSGRYIRDDLQAAIQSGDWAGLDAEERRALVDRIKREARADARSELGLGAPDGGSPPSRPGAPPPGYVLDPR